MKRPWARYTSFPALFSGGRSAIPTGNIVRYSDLTAWWGCEDEIEEIGGYNLGFVNEAEVKLTGGGSHGISTKSVAFDGVDDAMYSAKFDLDADDAISISCWMKNPDHEDRYGSSKYEWMSLIRLADTDDGVPTTSSIEGGSGRAAHSALSFSLNQSGIGKIEASAEFTTAGYNAKWVPRIAYHSGVGAGVGGTGGKFILPNIAPTTPAFDDEGSWQSDVWDLWVLTWASGQRMKLYRGSSLSKLDGSGTHTDSPPTLIGQSGAITDTLAVTSDVVMMAGGNALNNTAAYHGDNYMDDLRVYSVELTPAEIVAMHNGGDGDW